MWPELFLLVLAPYELGYYNPKYMDAKEAKQITANAHERMTREQSEALAEQQRLEQVRSEELLAEVAATRALIDDEIIKAASEGKSQVTYEHSVRISASRNTPEDVVAIKERASEVITGVILSLADEGFSQQRGESRDERDIRDNVRTPPEYYVIPLRVSWPASAN